MELLVPDYFIVIAAAGAAVLGLFIGFSGTLAFFAGGVAASMAVKFGWAPLACCVSTVWLRSLAMLVVALLAFGVVRFLVRRLVHGLVAQPGDAIFGSLIAAVTGFCLSAGGIWMLEMLGFAQSLGIRSAILERILSYVGA